MTYALCNSVCTKREHWCLCHWSDNVPTGSGRSSVLMSSCRREATVVVSMYGFWWQRVCSIQRHVQFTGQSRQDYGEVQTEEGTQALGAP